MKCSKVKTYASVHAPEHPAGVRAHLNACPACRRFFAEMSAIKQHLSGLRTQRANLEPDRSLAHNVRAELEAWHASRRPWHLLGDALCCAFSCRPVQGLAVAAAIFLAGFLVWPQPAPRSALSRYHHPVRQSQPPWNMATEAALPALHPTPLRTTNRVPKWQYGLDGTRLTDYEY